jgi:hypothetical protein
LPISVAPTGAQSPFVIVWMFGIMVLCLMILANVSFGLLSSMRAYVGGESLWSKAQKDAVFHLQKYAAGHAPEELRKFRYEIAVPLGDHEARLEMDKPDPDMQKVRQGFISGRNHPDDVDGMFTLYRRFGSVSYLRRAIQAWETGDRYIAQLNDAAATLQRNVESPASSPEQVRSILDQISAINEKLTPVENQFVDALSEGSRTAYRLIQAILLAATPGLLILGTALSTRCTSA